MQNQSVPLGHVNQKIISQPLLILMAALSGALLSIPFLSSDYYALTWIGFVPLLLAINNVRLGKSYFLGLITGLVFSVSASYWVIDFLMLSKGYNSFTSSFIALFFWFYCAQLFALITLSFKILKNASRIQECLLFPLIVVSVFSLYPMIFTVHLAESQGQFVTAIQAVEWAGVYGLDAIIALSNIVIFRLLWVLFSEQENRPSLFNAWPSLNRWHYLKSWPYAVAILLLALWFSYGWQANAHWKDKIDTWPTVRLGLVQPNEIPSLKEQVILPGYSRAYPPEMAMTERLASAGAKIVIWPEAKYKAYLDREQIAQAYQNQIDLLNIDLIFQDIERIKNPATSTEVQQFNSAVMLSKEGEMAAKYQKMKRIAFGEYVPFASDIPILKKWVEGFFGAFLNEMERGSSHQVFQSKLSHTTNQSTLNIIPLICYETTFPTFVASSVKQAVTHTQGADMLVGLSSDGWFGSTLQPYQHINSSILRAVENRLPFVHVLNNGPSIVAMPNGEVIFTTDANQAGGYIVDVPYRRNTQGSFFSHYPNFFINTVYFVLFLIGLFTFWQAKKKANIAVRLL